jgi:diguanylate cyclase (GGDEF)-like protein
MPLWLSVSANGKRNAPLRQPVETDENFSSVALVPLTALVICTVAILISALLFWGERTDVQAEARERALLETGLGHTIDRFQTDVSADASWDEAVLNVANDLDLDWIDQNFGKWLWDARDVETVILLDAVNQPIYASHRGEPGDLDDTRALLEQVTPLLKRLRSTEQVRQPRSVRKAGDAFYDPVHESSIITLNGTPHIVTLALIQPDFGTVIPRTRTLPVLIGVSPIDAAFADALSARFLINAVSVSARPAEHSRFAAVPLKTHDGTVAGWIQWQPQRVGALFKQTTYPIVALLCLAILGAALVFTRRARRLGISLEASRMRAQHLALHDAMTGLANRALFEQRLQQALDSLQHGETQVSVLTIDLDRFKEINDSLGHHEGDDLIREAARRLEKVVRATDTVARLGGDEFAIVQTSAKNDDADRPLAMRILEAFREPVTLVGAELFVSASIGIARANCDECDPIELMRRADIALYRSKSDGRNAYTLFESEMDESRRLRRIVELDLRRAIQAEELEVFYQPQYGIDGATLACLEALVRWRHPERGLISPGFFIPIAEESGLIRPLGDFIMKRVCQDARRWPNFKFAVNVSPAQLRSPDFAEGMVLIARNARVAPRQIEIEITETVLLKDDEQTALTLKRLKDVGFSLALDDFGTGYSSLSYLRRYPVDRIKIDRSFIASLGIQSDAAPVVGAIIALGRALGLSITAEGVETEDQLAFLRAAGCNHIQGFMFGKPAPIGEIDLFLSAYEETAAGRLTA